MLSTSEFVEIILSNIRIMFQNSPFQLSLLFLLNYGNKCFEAYSKLFVQYLVYYTIFVNSKKMKKFNKIVVDPFCKRQFVKGATGFIDYDIHEFEAKANEYFQKAELLDGYAPFCKHVFIENFANVLISTVQITPKNQHLLKTTYEARTPKELPVLKRFFAKEDVELKPAQYLDLILYSKEQVQRQNQAMGSVDPNANVDYDFGIVSVKPSDVPYETPMDPITIMRNALGKEHGGSGVALDREKYLESVKYWSNNALVK